jgi:hypothetical protein
LQYFQHPGTVCCITSITATLHCQVLLHLTQPSCTALKGTLCSLQLLLLGLQDQNTAAVALSSSIVVADV